MIELIADIESHFSVECNIRKLGELGYVRHPDFQIFGASMKVDDNPTEWVLGRDLPKYLEQFNPDDVRMISHNMLFDGLAFYEKLQFMPGGWVDTLGLCRALLPRGLDLSLDSVSRLLKISDGKREGGAALSALKGEHDPTPEQLARLGTYAIGDADDCRGIYDRLWPLLPEAERAFHQLSLRMALIGLFERSDEAMAALRDAKAEILEDRSTKLEAAGEHESRLTSRDVFAQLLRDRGVEPPTKISPRTGEETWAFSKQDPAYIALQADPRVAALINARMAVSSNNALSRIDRIETILNAPPHTLPVMVKYNGAHTGRLSGTSKINSQNLNARGVGSGLRRALRVRDDYVVLVADQSAVELRLNMWFCLQLDVLEVIRQGGDVYVEEASAQFKKPAADVEKGERQYGKVIRLGCQYGMGAPRFRIYVATGPLGSAPRYISLSESYDVINDYRARHHMVVSEWGWLTDNGLEAMATGTVIDRRCVQFQADRIELPSGLALTYPNVRPTENGWAFGYDSTTYTWGGTMLENICQALAGVLIKEQMVEIDKRLDGHGFTQRYTRREPTLPGTGGVVHQVHDEILTVCRLRDVDDVIKVTEDVMTTSPTWAPDLPLEIEHGYAQEYSK